MERSPVHRSTRGGRSSSPTRTTGRSHSHTGRPTTLSCRIGFPALARTATGLQHEVPCGQHVGRSVLHVGRFPKITTHTRYPTLINARLMSAACKDSCGETPVSKDPSTRTRPLPKLGALKSLYKRKLTNRSVLAVPNLIRTKWRGQWRRNVSWSGDSKRYPQWEE